MAGHELMIGQMRLASERAIAAALRAVDDMGDLILADAKKITPVSPTNPTIPGKRGKPIKNPYYTGAGGSGQGGSGTLRDSGTTDPAEVAGQEIVKVIKFTDSKAAAVHERPARHGRAFKAAFPEQHVPNLDAHWKFLAIPLIRRRKQVVEHVANAVRGVLDG